MPAANQADFFGEGVNATPAAPAYVAPGDQPNPNNPDGISDNELARRRAALAKSGVGGGYSVPGGSNKVTPGGGGNNYGVGDFFKNLGEAAVNPVAYAIGKGTQLVTGNKLAGQIAGIATGGTVPGALAAGGADLIGGLAPKGNPAAIAAGGTAGPAPGTPGAGGADAVLSSQLPSAQGQLAQGDALADQALATQPTVDASHQVNNANIQNLTPVVNPALAENDETDRALAMSQDLVDRVLNTPLQSKILADQALSNQLLVARSARGGAGATQNAVDTALGQAPQLLQQGAQASIQEQVARAGAAGQAASIYAGVAGNSADRAVRIAQGNQTAATTVMANLTQLTGQDLQFDAAKMQTIGQLARDYFNNANQFANMSTQLQIAQWQNLTQQYGIDKNFDAAVKKIAADEGIGPLDAFKMILGGAAAVGTIAAAV